MGVIKKPYEISLWEDILTFKYEDGTETEGAIENGHGPVIHQYYKERKICIIGSDVMDTPIRATSPKLVSKVNGENILTFNMYSHYYDTDANEYFVNPFIGLIVNERKIKLRYGTLGAESTKWYDFVIKNIQENSDTKTYSYTAKDLFVNELSKSGFNLEFAAELENNMGNINTLAERVLDESDWKLRDSGEILKQTIEEPLYQIQLSKDVTLTNMEDSSDTLTLAANKFIYAFYNNIVNEQPYVQFLYAEEYEVDDDHIITNSPNWFLDGVTYNSEGMPDFAISMAISDIYRGRRLVRKVRTKFDATINKYVNVYKESIGNGQYREIYGYTESDYTSPGIIQSCVTNPNNYDSYTGWETGCSSEGNFPELNLVSVPDIRDVNPDTVLDGTASFESCLKFEVIDTEQLLFNSGVVDMRHHIDGFVKDEKYIFRVKYGRAGVAGEHGAKTLLGSDISLILKVSEYTLENGKYTLTGTPYFECELGTSNTSSVPDYLVSNPIACTQALSYKEMIEMSHSLGMFIQLKTPGTIYIQDVQFFPYVDNNGEVLLPDEIQQGKVRTLYYYYVPSDEYKSIDDVKPIYKGETPSPAYEEAYNENSYEKIRSITASESNRFNLLQELCEIFECWVKFEIDHDPQTGMILMDEEYRQRKWVSFHEYIGNENYSGFKYGINLKNIQRTIDSEAIVSKLIVKNNSNEFAEDGFCSIARADESPNGENFILDFSYYIQHGMLGMSEITNDLYLGPNISSGWLGYYKELKRINDLRDKYIKEQSGLLVDITEYQASYQTYSLSSQEAANQQGDKLNYLESLTGFTFSQLMNTSVLEEKEKEKAEEWLENDTVLATLASIARLDTVHKNHNELANKAKTNLDAAQARYDELNRILASRKEEDAEISLLIQKEVLHRAFYKKYSRFLQEGSWISEDYIDDNLYFLDAQSTLATSSKPKITYNISVLELSQLEGYENYTFALGDKTTIEDTEFFGWVWNDGVQTPYREEIVVTELTIMLDQPEQNQIKVQNYKTQFEDLFQRMAATTQSVEYSTGKYMKVAGIVQQDGTINITTLQNSIANNALTLQNAKDQSVVWDETGITTTSMKNPAEIVRIVSGGVFLSVDGGITWNTGITGKGINASYITSGQMNVEEVNILNGSFPSFRWDNTGLSAYEFTLNDDTGQVSAFNFSKFVRLDQYGLYGINGYSNFNSAEKDENGLVGEEKIWEYSNFALTWKGFQIKSSHVQGGYVSITSDHDFQVINAKGNEQVKIGLLYTNGGDDGQTPIYGLQLRDYDQHLVMEHGSDGKMWIRNELKVGVDLSSVSIGYLEDTKAISYRNTIDFSDKTNEEIHQVINANNKFMVYEDGSMKATDGEFTGIIYATGGKIGNMEIESLIDPGYEVSIEIEEGTGTVFDTDGESKTLVAYLYKNGQKVTEGIKGYQWSKNSQDIEGATEQKLKIYENDIPNSASFTCAIDFGS